jgi:capsular exopolysaccharide synthesis family protein
MIETEKESPEDFNSGRRMDAKLVTIDFTPSPASEAFRKLRTRLVLDEKKDQPLTLIFTSLMPNEGKSLVVANMAITFAQLKKPTLLIDGDIRRGVLHNSFAMDKSPGLSELLAASHDLTVESVSNSIHKTTIPNLHLMPSGKEIPNPTELIMNSRMEDLFKQLQNRFHYIIIDTPPLGLIPDAFVFNKFIHSLVLVTRYGQTDVKKLKKEMAQFSDMQKDIKGLVLNGMKENKKKERYGYSYYKY